MNILFTCAGRRNYLINYFKDALKGRGKTIAVDSDPFAPAMHEADLSFTVPGVYEAGYISSLLALCSRQKVDLLVSLNDLELPVLARHREEFEKQSLTLLISNQGVIDVCADKLATFDFLQKNGIDTPRTYTDLVKVKSEIEAGVLDFPLMVKPRWGSASIGLAPVFSTTELDRAYESTKATITNSALELFGKEDSYGPVIIQEFIEGEEYGLDVLNNLNNEFVCVFAKRKLGMRAGETDRAVLSEEPRLYELGARLGKTLAHTANLDVDVFISGERIVVLELNPRFGGGYPFSHELGAEYPAALLAWFAGEEFDSNRQVRITETVVSKCDRLIHMQAASS